MKTGIIALVVGRNGAYGVLGGRSGCWDVGGVDEAFVASLNDGGGDMLRVEDLFDPFELLGISRNSKALGRLTISSPVMIVAPPAPHSSPLPSVQYSILSCRPIQLSGSKEESVAAG